MNISHVAVGDPKITFRHIVCESTSEAINLFCNRGLVVGRILIGLGIGVSAVVVPAYLGELSPAKLRGRIVEVYELVLCVGMLAAVLADAALQDAPNNWRWMVGLPVVPGLVLSGKPLI